MVEWMNGLAWGWGILLGCGLVTVFVFVFIAIPLLIMGAVMDEREYKRQERQMIQSMDWRVRIDCKRYGLSKKHAAKIIANRNRKLKLHGR